MYFFQSELAPNLFHCSMEQYCSSHEWDTSSQVTRDNEPKEMSNNGYISMAFYEGRPEGGRGRTNTLEREMIALQKARVNHVSCPTGQGHAHKIGLASLIMRWFRNLSGYFLYLVFQAATCIYFGDCFLSVGVEPSWFSLFFAYLVLFSFQVLFINNSQKPLSSSESQQISKWTTLLGECRMSTLLSWYCLAPSNKARLESFDALVLKRKFMKICLHFQVPWLCELEKERLRVQMAAICGQCAFGSEPKSSPGSSFAFRSDMKPQEDL